MTKSDQNNEAIEDIQIVLSNPDGCIKLALTEQEARNWYNHLKDTERIRGNRLPASEVNTILQLNEEGMETSRISRLTGHTHKTVNSAIHSPDPHSRFFRV